jgi:hypothetical protein
MHGRLPVWNYFEGLGQPLVGEAQSAALFPATSLLLLPGGQTIEHAILQIIGGLGVFRLLRALQFRNSTCTVIAVAFEFCSLFVWLKNAMINPIGFLIWLLVFSLRLIKAKPDEAWQANAVGMGLAAGFSVLGGFPETVLIFSVFLLAWILFYAAQTRLDAHALIRLAARLAIALVIAILVGSPLLIGLGAFLPFAIAGGHLDPGNGHAHLSWQTALKYLLPYLTGPIFGFPVEDETGSIGGYTGIALVLLACLGLLAARRQSERLFWAAAAALCLAASHGVPLIQQAVMTIPGLGLTAFYRQADVVWILCLMLLAAHGLDSLRIMSRRRMALAVCSFAIIAASLVVAAPDARTRWAAMPDVQYWLIVSFGLGALIFLATTAATFARRPGIVASLLLGETALLFLLPILSLPTVSRTDWGFIDFLRHNAGAGRVVNFSTNVIQPNFGSALGIRQLNYNDLPVPAATAAYIHDKLDPMYPDTSTIYIPDYPQNGDDARRSTYMAAHIQDYRAAGVKYVLAAPDGFGIASSTQTGTNKPFNLNDGDSMTLRVRVEPRGEPGTGTRVTGRLSLRVATYNGTSDGELHVRICGSDGTCATKNINSQDLTDNAYCILVDHASFDAEDWLDLSITKVGGTVPVAIWLYGRGRPVQGGLAIGDVKASRFEAENRIPDIFLSVDLISQMQRVYRGDAGDIYELANPRPYIAADGCTVSLMTFDKAAVDCARPSTLTRLELWMPGWRSHVDSTVVPITDGAPFQQIAVGAGQHIVSFDYDPYGLKISMVASILTSLLGLSTWLWLKIRTWRSAATAG